MSSPKENRKEVKITSNGRILVKATVSGKVTWKKKAELYVEALTDILGECCMTIDNIVIVKKEVQG